MFFVHSRMFSMVTAFSLVMAIASHNLRSAETQPSVVNEVDSLPVVQLRDRLERALDSWCHWLAGYLYRIPGTDLYTLNPTLGTGRNPYRDVAGNQFAAAAAGYWLKRAQADEEIARPLRGLIKLALGTHIAVNTIDRPDIQKWGATLSHADDWHADLFAAAGGMLMIDRLPPQQGEQMRAILAWEADKQVEYGISKKWRTWPGRWPEHSCGESNAWSAALLQVARTAWPGDSRQESWRSAAIALSLNAICTPADMTSRKVVAGKPLKERVKGANFEPGGIQEHHGFYHPGYMGWPLAYQAYAYLMDQQLPETQRNTDVYLHNWKYVYDRLKQGTFSNGRFVYCAGFDWISYGYGNSQFLPAVVFAAAHYKDPHSTRLADRWLSLIEHQQKLTKGSIQGARLATMQRYRMNDFAWYEAQEGCCLAQALWVLDRVNNRAIPNPSTGKEYNQHNVGTYYEPNARLVWHRDMHRWASFCWRSAFGECQAIVQPVRLPHLLKFNHNSAGIIEAVGTNDEMKVEQFKIQTFEEGGFWSLGSIGRHSKKVIHGRPSNRVFPMVRQHQALIALPDGPSVFIDLCQALDQIWLLHTGSLGLRLAADLFNNRKVKFTIGGKEKVFGQHPVRDTWHDLKSRSVTIEKLLTVHALTDDGTFRLLQKRKRPDDRSEMLYINDPFGVEESLLTHELYFGPPAYDRPRIVSPQEWFRKNVFVFYCDPQRTPNQPKGLISGDYPCLTVHLDDVKCTIAVNFAHDEQSVDSAVGRIVVGPQSVKVVR
ncbi:MAG: hypothetical protein ACYTBZ_01280 [Planctomycetota bacterium]